MAYEEHGMEEFSTCCGASIEAPLRPRSLAPHLERVREWPRPQDPPSRGLSLVKVHRLLAREGVVVPYSSLHRWATSELGFSDKMVGRSLKCRARTTASRHEVKSAFSS